MIFSVGDIVTTSVGGPHKRVAFVDRSFVRLEYYDEMGPQVENVNPARCLFVSDKPTPEWQNMLAVEATRVKASRKFHDEHPTRIGPIGKKKVFGTNN